MARAGTLPIFFFFFFTSEKLCLEKDVAGDIHRSDDEDGYATCNSAEEEEIDEKDDR